VTELLVSTRGKLASFIRLLASDRDGEVVAAARALERVLKSAGADIHALADQVEHTNGGGLTEAEMKKLFDAGYEAGVRAAEAKVQHDEDGFRSVNGAVSWHKMAVFCQDRKARLRGNEVDFIDEMCGWTTWKEPTSKQAKWLSSIYARLGGR
jgi:hypothetical protein